MRESKPLPTECGNCGEKLPDEVPGVEPSKRKPCPACGATARRFAKELIAEPVEVHPQLAHKAKKAGEKKPFLEGRSGDDLHRDTGTFHVLDRTIDRRKDQYDEQITDKETGAVVREVHEPLSKHVGRGSAKGKEKPDEKGEP